MSSSVSPADEEPGEVEEQSGPGESEAPTPEVQDEPIDIQDEAVWKLVSPNLFFGMLVKDRDGL